MRTLAFGKHKKQTHERERNYDEKIYGEKLFLFFIIIMRKILKAQKVPIAFIITFLFTGFSSSSFSSAMATRNRLKNR